MRSDHETGSHHTVDLADRPIKIRAHPISLHSISLPTLEATQGQIDSFFGQLPYKCYLEEVASVGD